VQAHILGIGGDALYSSRLKMVTNYFENRKFHATDKRVLWGLFFFFFFLPRVGWREGGDNNL
jgi:hypothetical protein